MSQPLVAVSTDIRVFDNYTWHAAPQQYLAAALEKSGAFPLMVPALGDGLDYDSLLGAVDGVLLTGSKTNVHPPLYGAEPTERDGPYDPARDATTLPLIRASLKRGVPLLAICRGAQELNVALGGTLATEIQELEGRMDHRAPLGEDQDARFAIRHRISIREGGCLAAIYRTPDIEVNSVHRQAIGRLSERLAVEAEAPDGTIEAVSVPGAAAFALGVQWHPEYWAASDAASARIFEVFGEAARRHRDMRAAGR